jgi:indoleamine 2,3-dioxygenase
MTQGRQIELTEYGVDPVRGFLPAEDPLAALPPSYRVWDTLATEVPARLLSGGLRARVDALDPLPLDGVNDDRTLERAMLVLSVIGTAYVWAGPEPARRLPPGVAQPWWEAAQRIGRPPIIVHGSLVLNHWRRLDHAGPLTLDNLDTLLTFLGGSDERWFYLVTVAIEAAGGPSMAALVAAQAAAGRGDIDGVLGVLPAIVRALEAMTAALQRMLDRCDPYIFYHRVRPYLSSWPEGGLLYEGADPQPRHYSGGSAAQSSLIQALDAGLGIRHVSPFLAEMRQYMPPQHRRFVEALETGPSLRAFAAAHPESPALREGVNTCIDLLDAFRQIHMAYSVRFIKQQAPPDTTAIGTGGTDFVTLLSEARKETRAGRV